MAVDKLGVKQINAGRVKKAHQDRANYDLSLMNGQMYGQHSVWPDI